MQESDSRLQEKKNKMQQPSRRSLSTNKCQTAGSQLLEQKDQQKLREKEQDNKRWERAQLDQMSRRDFAKWCRKQLNALHMKWIAEAKSENDSWGQVSVRKNVD